MQYRYLWFLAVIGVFAACTKQNEIVTTPQQPPDSAFPTVLLKDIVMSNLPSPYYHFEYNADSTISVASFASDFKRYEVRYVNGRISEMVTGLQEKLQYIYDNTGKLMTVNYFDQLGTFSMQFLFTYEGQKLIKLERNRLLGTIFILNKTMSFFYHPDGNLKEIIDHRPAVNGVQPESTTSDRFTQYDNKVNVDDFGLIHNDFFDQLLLLPGVQFQKNNPVKEIFTATENSYEVNYTYTYNDKGVPINKTGEMIMTAGVNAGQRFQTNSFYSYY